MHNYFIHFKLKILYIFCKTVMKPSNKDKITYNKEIQIKKSNIKLVKTSSFNVLELYYNRNKYFFRECKIHANFKSYIEECLNDYFYFFNTSQQLLENKDLIYSVFLKRNVLKKIYNMGTENDKYSYTYKFFQTKNLTILNLEKLNYINIEDIISLVNYLKGNVNCYRLNCGIKIGKYEIFNVNKALSYIKLAKILNLDYLIPNFDIVKLNIDDSIIKYGSLMESANGISPLSLGINQRNNITPTFQKYINNLNLLDVISLDKDHRPSNYMVSQFNHKINSLQVFDIDYPTSFFISNNINMITGLGSGPFVNKDNIINIPYLDYEVVKKIMSIKMNELKNEFTDTLNLLQILFLQKRIKKLKKAIKKSIKYDKLKLLKNNEWNYGTIKYELLNCKIDSYLKIFVSDKCK